MSDNSSKLHQRAVYLRNLLIAHVTGRSVNEADYHKLRHYFMGHKDTSRIIPSVIEKHPDLSDLWQMMKYNYASHEDRKAFIDSEFSPFLAKLSPDSSQPSQALLSQNQFIDEPTLLKHWLKANEMLEMNPPVASEQMKVLLEKLCHQILRELKVVPDPRQHDLTPLVSLTERSLLLSPGKQHYLVIKALVAGCSEAMSAIDNLTAEGISVITDQAAIPKIDKPTSRVLINLYGSLASMLLSGWRVRQMLVEGNSQR